MTNNWNDDPKTQSTAYKIHLLRTKKGWSQEQLAKETKIGRTTITLYENEKANKIPGHKNIQRLANAFGVSTDYLLGNTSVNDAFPSMNKDAEICSKYTGLSEQAIAILHKYPRYVDGLNEILKDESVGRYFLEHLKDYLSHDYSGKENEKIRLPHFNAKTKVMEHEMISTEFAQLYLREKLLNSIDSYFFIDKDNLKEVEEYEDMAEEYTLNRAIKVLTELKEENELKKGKAQHGKHTKKTKRKI